MTQGRLGQGLVPEPQTSFDGHDPLRKCPACVRARHSQHAVHAARFERIEWRGSAKPGMWRRQPYPDEVAVAK